MASAVKALRPNHWTTREFQSRCFNGSLNSVSWAGQGRLGKAAGRQRFRWGLIRQRCRVGVELPRQRGEDGGRSGVSDQKQPSEVGCVGLCGFRAGLRAPTGKFR